MDEISFEAFAGRLGHRFVLRWHETSELGEPIAAVLIECSAHPDDGRSTGYTLTFRAPLSAPIAQGNYLVEGDGLTPSLIFLVPARQTPDGVDYHAVFVHLTEIANAS